MHPGDDTTAAPQVHNRWTPASPGRHSASQVRSRCRTSSPAMACGSASRSSCAVSVSAAQVRRSALGHLFQRAMADRPDHWLVRPITVLLRENLRDKQAAAAQLGGPKRRSAERGACTTSPFWGAIAAQFGSNEAPSRSRPTALRNGYFLRLMHLPACMAPSSDEGEGVLRLSVGPGWQAALRMTRIHVPLSHRQPESQRFLNGNARESHEGTVNKLPC